jgi:hypothetical protein
MRQILHGRAAARPLPGTLVIDAAFDAASAARGTGMDLDRA